MAAPFHFCNPAASMHLAVTRPVSSVFVLLENFGHVRMADRRARGIDKKILFRHIGDVFGLRIFGEQMIERLVLARTDLRRDCLPPLLGVVEHRIDIEDHAPQARRAEVDIRREFLSRWADRPITGITRRDVLAVIDGCVDRGNPYQAHNLLGYARRIFNWAIARGVYGLESSPCDRMRPREIIGAKKVRTRVLSNDELRALWRASEAMGYPYGALFQMLAVTGQRKSEVAEARWSEFDLQKKLWEIPAERMKSDAGHAVPLSDEAVKVLLSLPRFTKGDFLFSASYGARPVVGGFDKAKKVLDTKMRAELRRSFPPFVIHDIRRTMRTGLSTLPVPDLIRELVIAHTKPGLHKVYDQHAYLDEKRQALDLWAGRLRDIVTPPPANVVELPKRAGERCG
jgi:integrase